MWNNLWSYVINHDYSKIKVLPFKPLMLIHNKFRIFNTNLYSIFFFWYLTLCMPEPQIRFFSERGHLNILSFVVNVPVTYSFLFLATLKVWKPFSLDGNRKIIHVVWSMGSILPNPNLNSARIAKLIFIYPICLAFRYFWNNWNKPITLRTIYYEQSHLMVKVKNWDINV